MCFGGGKKDDREQRGTRLVTSPQHRHPAPTARPQHAHQPGSATGPSSRRQQSGRGNTPAPRITTQSMNRQDLLTASFEAGQVLRGQPYALIGGAACSLLGSQRGTADLDILVPEGQKRATQLLLADAPTFGYDAQTRQTWFNAPNGNYHNIDVMAGSRVGTVLDSQTPTMLINGARVLPPGVLLRMKCLSWSEMDTKRDQTKKGHDAGDIRFLLEYMVENRITVDPQVMRGVNGDFFDGWLRRYPETQQDWLAVGMRI